MREKRRMRLLTRQLQVARVARRGTLAALADAAGEEARTATLASRTRDLATSYSDLSRVANGADMTERGCFAASLDAIARDADHATREAARRTQAHARTLTEADTREQRLSERLRAARRAVRRIEERRDAPVAKNMARGLLSGPCRQTRTPLQSEPDASAALGRGPVPSRSRSMP